MSYIADLNDYLEDFIFATDGEWQTMLDVSYMIGKLFMLLVIAGIAYKTMADEGGLDVMRLWRPIAISFALAYWWPLSYTLSHITQGVEDYLHQSYLAENQRVDVLRRQRRVAQKKLSMALMDQFAEQKTKQIMERDVERETTAEDNRENKTGELSGVLAEHFDDVWYPDSVTTEAESLNIEQAGFLEETEGFAIWLVETAWEVMAMLIFFVRNLYLAVLVFFGPLWMVASMLPAWKDAWAQWAGSVITVSLWGGIAYLVMTFSLYLMDFGASTDVNGLQTAVSDDHVFYGMIQHLCNGGGTIMLTVIAALVGTLALAHVPELASMCWPSEVAVKGASAFVAGSAAFVSTEYRRWRMMRQRKETMEQK